MKVSIIVPVLNERVFIENTLTQLKETLSSLKQDDFGNWEVIISDAGSTDGTLSLIDKFLHGTASWLTITEPIPNPSVGKTIVRGIHKATGDIILILPADSQLTPEGFRDLWTTLQSGTECGGFVKRYFPSNYALVLYQTVQNLIRLKCLRHLVWTNGIFFKKSLLSSFEFPTIGFLEDVILSDFLRKVPTWRVLSTSITVSSRRYYPNRILKRILINLFIMFCYRTGIASPEQLKAIYS
ncbi:MAG: glycosyltransferase [Bdellovibrionales bacterium]